jgi:calmodulin
MRSLGLNPTNKEITDLIAEVDKNGKMKKEIFCSILSRISLGNQRLDFQEFVAFMSKHWHERDQEAELREAFRLFDRDNSGYITINELKQVEIIPLNRFVFQRGLFFFQGYAQYG